MEQGKGLEDYESMLINYIAHKKERTLYNGQKLSRKMIEHNVSPEEVVSMHIDVLNRRLPDLDERVRASFDFLLEVMVGYGFAYREHQSLRNRQFQLDSEINIAANVQQSLLEGTIPSCDFVDIGAISTPAKKMSGDYYQFVKDNDNFLSVAVADIVGKGIPAAMCMSMIKYAMDSLPEQRREPHAVLASLNHVVEQNVDPSMFITMFYGFYNTSSRQFFFASAGHEPGFYYSRAKDTFEELEARGMALGLSKKTKYNEYVKSIYPGDMIVLLSDGVTECRTKSGFIERDEIVAIIRRNMCLPAQQIVGNVFYELERLQDFELRDDFTLIVMKF